MAHQEGALNNKLIMWFIATYYFFNLTETISSHLKQGYLQQQKYKKISVYILYS